MHANRPITKFMKFESMTHTSRVITIISLESQYHMKLHGIPFCEFLIFYLNILPNLNASAYLCPTFNPQLFALISIPSNDRG